MIRMPVTCLETVLKLETVFSMVATSTLSKHHVGPQEVLCLIVQLYMKVEFGVLGGRKRHLSSDVIIEIRTNANSHDA